ncbi:MAG: AtuA-related protein [Ramlibacter sp.]
MTGRMVPLYRLAHGRTGDKGDRSSISVVAFDAASYPVLVEQVTEAAVATHFALRQPQSVRRYLLPRLGAINFVLDGVLDGGVNASLNLDAHGKALSSFLLELEVRVHGA